jgi:hypothetical protein
MDVVTSPCGRRFKVCKGPDLKGRRRRIAGGDYLPVLGCELAIGDGAKELVKLRVKGGCIRVLRRRGRRSVAGVATMIGKGSHPPCWGLQDKSLCAW